MKKLLKSTNNKSLLGIPGIVFLFYGCADLTVTNMEMNDLCPTSLDTISISATVKNRSTWRAAKANSLSFKIGNEPAPVVIAIPRLEPNQTYQVNRALQLPAADYTCEVKVDIANVVRESRETNNSATFNFTTTYRPKGTGIQDSAYNEGLASILRGVIIDDATALTLQVPAGYYRVREFRMSYVPPRKAIVLCIQKNYSEVVLGTSIIPHNIEPWVFTVTQKDIFEPQSREYEGFDLHGHLFKYKMHYDTIKTCWQVNAGIDCSSVVLTTHTYTTNVYNACVPDSEPAWTPVQ